MAADAAADPGIVGTMESWAVVVMISAVMAAFLSGFALLAIRARRRSLGLSFLQPFAVLWSPAQVRTEVVVEAKTMRGDEAEGDGDRYPLNGNTPGAEWGPS